MIRPAFLFPGQGSQTPGMAKGFWEDAATQHLFQLADDTLGFHLTRLMLEGPDDDLRLTHNAQPALLLAGYAAAHYLLKALNQPLTQAASYVAGHSLGEYTAVAVAGGMDLPTALKLVRLRGEAMTRAVPAGQGGMLAIIGMELPIIEAVCRSLRVTLANDNAQGQVIVSGELSKLKHVEEEVRNHGARKVIALNVAGPFHTPAMQPAAQAVEACLNEKPLANLAVPLVMNATATAHQKPLEVAQHLVGQITTTVRWRESMQFMANHKVTQVLELGVGKVLTGLASRCDTRLNGIALDSPKAIDTYLESMAT